MSNFGTLSCTYYGISREDFPISFAWAFDTSRFMQECAVLILHPAVTAVEGGGKGGLGDVLGHLPDGYDDISVARYTFTDSSPCNYRITTPRLRVIRSLLPNDALNFTE